MPKQISLLIFVALFFFVCGSILAARNVSAANGDFPADVTMVNIATSTGEIDIAQVALAAIVNPQHKAINARVACTTDGKTSAYLSSKTLTPYHMWAWKNPPTGSLHCIAKIPANTKIQYILAVKPQ